MTYKELYRESIEKPDSFWGRVAEEIVWDRQMIRC